MSNSHNVAWPPSDHARLGRQFSRFGRIGFILQVILLTIPLLLAFYVLFLASPDGAARRGIDLSNYLSYGSLLVMLFTAFWFYRYMRLGNQLQDEATCPPQSRVISTLWVGLWASCLGIFFSILLLLGAASRMLFLLLATPQTGLMIAPPLGDDPTGSISALDAVSQAALLILLAAELVVLGLTLWLLFRTTRPSEEQSEAALA